MSTYDLINKLEKLEYFNDLLTSGIVPTNLLDYKVIFEFYEKEIEKQQKKESGRRKQALYNTAQEFGVSERNVYLIIQKMKG